MKCPECGAEIDIPEDDEDDSIECPECGATVPLKAHKAIKAARVQIADACKKMSDAIDARNAVVQKDMGQIGRLADILQGIRWLQESSAWEGRMEGDFRDFAIAEDLKAWLDEGVNILNNIVADETSELTEEVAVPGQPALAAAIQNKEGDIMKFDELFNKAAKGLKAHFGKAAGFHEAMAEAHKAMGEFHSGKEEKAFHTKASKAHGAMADACKAAAEGVGNEEAKADEPTDLVKVLGDSQTAFSAVLATQLDPITKALAGLEKLEALGKAVEALQADVTKFGNEVVPVRDPVTGAVVKQAGTALIARDGKTLTPPAAATGSVGDLL